MKPIRSLSIVVSSESYSPKVHLLAWHPTAEHLLLTSSHDQRILLWHTGRGVVVRAISLPATLQVLLLLLLFTPTTTTTYSYFYSYYVLLLKLLLRTPTSTPTTSSYFYSPYVLLFLLLLRTPTSTTRYSHFYSYCSDFLTPGPGS